MDGCEDALSRISRALHDKLLSFKYFSIIGTNSQSALSQPLPTLFILFLKPDSTESRDFTVSHLHILAENLFHFLFFPTFYIFIPHRVKKGATWISIFDYVKGIQTFNASKYN